MLAIESTQGTTQPVESMVPIPETRFEASPTDLPFTKTSHCRSTAPKWRIVSLFLKESGREKTRLYQRVSPGWNWRFMPDFSDSMAKGTRIFSL